MKSIQLPSVLGMAFALFFAGCVTPVQRLEQTPSGNPEVVIATKDVGRIKAAIIGEMVNSGYSIQKDTEYLLELSRAPNNGENFALALGAGNSYSSNRVYSTFSFVPVDAGVRVIVSVEGRAMMPGGQINSMPLMNNLRFNTYTESFREIKKRIENSEKLTPAPTPPIAAAVPL